MDEFDQYSLFETELDLVPSVGVEPPLDHGPLKVDLSCMPETTIARDRNGEGIDVRIFLEHVAADPDLFDVPGFRKVAGLPMGPLTAARLVNDIAAGKICASDIIACSRIFETQANHDPYHCELLRIAKLAATDGLSEYQVDQMLGGVRKAFSVKQKSVEKDFNTFPAASASRRKGWPRSSRPTRQRCVLLLQLPVLLCCARDCFAGRPSEKRC